MNGLMMDMPLLISDLIKHADRNHGETEIVSKTVEGNIHRYTYRDCLHRARQLGAALRGLGLESGDDLGAQLSGEIGGKDAAEHGFELWRTKETHGGTAQWVVKRLDADAPRHRLVGYHQVQPMQGQMR